MYSLDTTRIKRAIVYGQLIVLFSAFASIYPQIHGLFGERGLVPVAPMLECEEESISQCRLPLLRFICNLLHLSPSVGLQVLVLAGICISVLAILHPVCQNIITFLILYFIYRTIYEAGGVFMYYQWDALLLESTIYVGVLAWLQDGPADSIALYGIVVLLVRVFFMNGATKLLSKSPTWWNLTALNYHFESQMMPTPLAWYAHHSPAVYKQFATLVMYFFEILLPSLFLIPVIHVRYFVFFCQVLLMTLTLFTGNNGFFNYSLIVLLVSLLDAPRVPLVALSLSALIFSKIGYGMAYHLPYKLVWNEENVPSFVLNLTYESFRNFMLHYIDFMVTFIAFAFVVVVVYSSVKVPNHSALNKILHLFFASMSIAFLNVYGSIPLLRLDEKLAEKTTSNPINMSYKAVNSWGLANSYGSYRQMTGMYGRPEIVIEGSHNIEGPWREIEFHSKPVKLWKRPEFISPHHPRLDMQMYYAAEGTYQQNPFFMSLVYHLMQNTTEVVKLIHNFPFTNRSEPMRFARAKLYMYHFSDIGDSNWWRRDFQEEYMPTFNKGNEALVKYLTEHKIINRKKSEFVNGPLGKFLKQWHFKLHGADKVVFIATAVVLVFIGNMHNRFPPVLFNHGD